MFESLSRIPRSVRRTRASDYLSIMLFSFAISVTLTRVFLNLTGYPRLGGGNIHIAHLLWGGLLLFAATLLPLMFTNRWVFPATAVLSGVGIGLFIDEVGKYITSAYDYFYPPAAPIIYSFFLITCLLYIRMRKPMPSDARSAMYQSFDMMEEILEHEIDSAEKEKLLALLESVQNNSDDSGYQRLAEEMIEFVKSTDLRTIEKKEYFPDRVRQYFANFMQKFESRKRLLWFIILALLGLGISDLIYPLRFFIAIPNVSQFPGVVMPYILSQKITSNTGLDWLTARVTLQAMVSLILIVAAMLLILHHTEKGLSFAFLGMLLQLTTLDLLIFYFDQFSTIANVVIQVVIFFAIQKYRRVYLTVSPE